MLQDAVHHPELYPDKLTIIVMDEKMEWKVLTPQRLRLLRTLHRQEVGSISELAAVLRRPIKSVSRDLKLLEAYGFVRLKAKGRSKCPQLTKELIVIPLDRDDLHP